MYLTATAIIKGLLIIPLLCFVTGEWLKGRAKLPDRIDITISGQRRVSNVKHLIPTPGTPFQKNPGM